jgi:lactobin A/cerein 7B family class IIb bacteriocin
VWPHQRKMAALANMEKIMSKTNNNSKLGRAPQVRELRDDELQEVSGGVGKGSAIIVFDYEGSALRGGTVGGFPSLINNGTADEPMK